MGLCLVLGLGMGICELVFVLKMRLERVLGCGGRREASAGGLGVECEREQALKAIQLLKVSLAPGVGEQVEAK